MRLDMGRRSGNVEDRRGMGGPVMVGGGCGTLVIILIALYFGVDPQMFLGTQQGPMAPQEQQGPTGQPQDQAGDFVAAVLGDTEDTWNTIFRDELGREYEEPKLVLFTQATRSACGVGQAAMGPFYCPLDQAVYIDLSFYNDLRQRFGAPGDFAQAYVIAHEVGHHVQKLLGVSDEVHSARRRLSEEEGNQLSVLQELQADCYAGVWGNHAQKYRNILEPGDVEEALRAAAAIGDDRIQAQTQGQIVPESFTHGSSEQRVEWFRRGFESGDIRQCDTFQRGVI
jgi:predicted metalloprotease